MTLIDLSLKTNSTIC